MTSPHHIPRLEDYEPFVGPKTVERLLRKVEPLRDLHVVNIHSTYYGRCGPPLRSMTLLMNTAGIRTGWRVIQGPRISLASPRKCTMPCRATRST